MTPRIVSSTERPFAPPLPTFCEDGREGVEANTRGIAHKEVVLRVHLVPFLGRKKLDAITNEDVQRLKDHLRQKAARTVNNVLTVLSMTLKKAVEWGVIDGCRASCGC